MYIATCQECDFHVVATDYEDRAEEVGAHRVKTGHSVNFSETP